MAQVPTVTFEVRTARDNEAGASSAAQFFTGFPSAPQGVKRWFQSPQEFTLEWLSQGQTIYSFLTVPTTLQSHTASQLAGAYPEVLIQPLEHDPLVPFYQQELPIAWAELTLAAPAYLPLRTFQEFKDTDPLASVLSALSKLIVNETALIQFRFHRENDSWKNPGYTLLHPVKSAEGTSSSPHPHRDKIASKLQEQGFAVSIHVVVQSTDKTRAQLVLDSLTTAFNAFQSEVNSFAVSKPFFGRASRLEQILNRTVKIRKQYLTTSELATLFHFPNEKLSVIRNIAWGKSLLGEPPENLPVYANVPEDQRDDMNLFGRAEYKNQPQVFGLKRDDRRRHMYTVGKSGTGKSTLLANMIINDLKHDEGLAVVDPHGDLIETILDYIPKRRLNDVVLVDPSDPDAVVKLNLFDSGSSMVHREIVASGIVSIFQKMYGHTWGPRLEYILRNSLMTLLHHDAKLSDIVRILTDKKYRDAIANATEDQVLRNFWFAEFNTLTEKQRMEAISPILNKVGQFVTSPLLREIVNTKTSSIDIEEIMDKGKILLVNVSQGKLGEDNAALLGAMIITKIQLAAMNRVYTKEEDRRDFYLYIDEFQNFATTSFVKILSEARKYRLNLILANQYIDQIPEEVRTSIFGNAGNLISFIVGANDAAHLTKEFGGRYSAEDLVALGRYQIICRLLIDGHPSLPFPAHTLNLASSRNQNREKAIKVSRERYSRPRGERS